MLVDEHENVTIADLLENVHLDLGDVARMMELHEPLTTFCLRMVLVNGSAMLARAVPGHLAVPEHPQDLSVLFRAHRPRVADCEVVLDIQRRIHRRNYLTGLETLFNNNNNNGSI